MKKLKKLYVVLLMFVACISLNGITSNAATEIESVSVDDMTIEVGNSKRIQFITVPEGASTRTGKAQIDDTSIVEYSFGILTGLKAGQTSVRVAELNSGQYCTFNVNVVLPSFTVDDAIIEVGECVTLEIKDNGYYSYDIEIADENVLESVSGKLVQGKTPGSTKVTFIEKQSGAKASCTVTVKKPTIKSTTEIPKTLYANDFESVTLYHSAAVKLDAKLESSDASVLAVEKGLVTNSQVSIKLTGKKPGKATVTATLDGADPYTFTVEVLSDLKYKIASTSISIDKYGTQKIALQSCKRNLITETWPKDDYSDLKDNKIKWSSSNKKVAAISVKNGICTVKAKNTGRAKIKATYNGVTYSCNVKVVKPTIKVGAYMSGDSTSKCRVVCISITNKGTRNLKISKSAQLNTPGYKLLRRKTAMKRDVIIKPGKTKILSFYVKGRPTYYGSDSALNITAKFEGKSYKLGFSKNKLYNVYKGKDGKLVMQILYKTK